MPYTTLVAGTTITASWANANVRDQTIAPFASASARDSAITAPIEGQYAHLTNTNKLTHYNGTDWAPATSNIIGTPFTATSSNGPHTTNATTDFAVATFPALATRLYQVHMHSSWSVTAGAVWTVNLHVDGIATERFYEVNTAGAASGTISSSILWQPTSGTKSLDVRVVEVSGTGDLTFNGLAAVSRMFWVEDIGPR